MKKFSSLLLVSALGGALTLGSYKLFFEKNNKSVSFYKEQMIKPKFTSYATPAENTDFTMAAKETVNAVVHVKNVSIQTFQDPMSGFFYGNSMPRQFKQVGTGSGVIISADGYIITNNHVIKDAKTIEITLNNKKKYKAKIIGADPNTDIALVKIDAKNLPYIPFGNSDNLKVGQWVLAVGNPFNLTSTVTAGIISAKGRDINILKNSRAIESYIQTDAVVNPGNSGGALVNTRGELIGINSAIESQTGSYIGYSFAVPSNIAKKVVQDLMEYGSVQRAYLGIRFVELNGDNQSKYNVSVSEGILINEVLDQGAAQIAGLRKNDVIVKMDNVNITKFSNLSGFLGAKRPGDKVKVTVLRNGEKKVFNVSLKNQFGKEKSTSTDYVKYYIGDLTKLSNKENEKFGLDYGLVIKSINNKTLLKFGVEPGDILLGINKLKIQDINDVIYGLKNIENEDYVVLKVLDKEGNLNFIPLRAK